MVVFGQKLVVFGQKWFSSDESGSIRAKEVLFGQSGCIWANVLRSSRIWCIRAKVVVFGQSG